MMRSRDWLILSFVIVVFLTMQLGCGRDASQQEHVAGLVRSVDPYLVLQMDGTTGEGKAFTPLCSSPGLWPSQHVGVDFHWLNYSSFDNTGGCYVIDKITAE